MFKLFDGFLNNSNLSFDRKNNMQQNQLLNV